MERGSLEQRDFLNPTETIKCFGLKARTFYKFLEDGTSKSFLALYKSRKLIIRTQFEKYLEENPMVKEELISEWKTKNKA